MLGRWCWWIIRRNASCPSASAALARAARKPAAIATTQPPPIAGRKCTSLRSSTGCLSPCRLVTPSTVSTIPRRSASPSTSRALIPGYRASSASTRSRTLAPGTATASWPPVRSRKRGGIQTVAIVISPVDADKGHHKDTGELGFSSCLLCPCAFVVTHYLHFAQSASRIVLGDIGRCVTHTPIAR